MRGMLPEGFRESLSRSGAAVLGSFEPSRYHENVIAVELQEWLQGRGITRAATMHHKRLPIGVRNPVDNWSIAQRDIVVTQWHRDGAGTYATAAEYIPDLRWLLVWSNKTPTEIENHQFLPFDVIVFDNRRLRHRTPPAEADRWFVRLLEPILDADP